MLNRVKILKFEVWDGETGEADVTAQLKNGSQVKAFSMDSFEENQEANVVISLFCKDSEIIDQEIPIEIQNKNDKYQVSLQGKITDFISDDEQGEIIVVDIGETLIDVYSADIEGNKELVGKYFKGSGRLDIETEPIS